MGDASKTESTKAESADAPAAEQAATSHDDKQEIEFDATMSRGEALSYFEAIVAGLKSGRLEFRQEGDAVVFNLPERVEIEIAAKLKGDKGKIEFGIEWSKKTRALEISS